MATTTFPTRDDFAALLNESLGGENEAFEGKVVKGTVTAIENDMAVIDVGLKSEGRVALREFAAPGQKAELKVGEIVSDLVQQFRELGPQFQVFTLDSEDLQFADKLKSAEKVGDSVHVTYTWDPKDADDLEAVEERYDT